MPPHDLVAQYLVHRVAIGELVASSATVIGAVLRQWVRHAGPDPQEWTLEAVAAWVQDGRLRSNTRKSRLTKLRPFCRWLEQEGHLDRDPTIRMAGVRVPPGAPRDLSVDEVRAVLAKCPDLRARLIVLLMVQVGLRDGDVARVRVEDIDRRRRMVNVRAKGGRGDPTHWDPIPEEAWQALDAHLRATGLRSGPLIRSYTDPGRGLRPDTVGHLVTEWMWAAGVKTAPWDGVSPHSFRHTCAQDMLDGGADIRDVQFALGHRSIRSTELYLRREPPGLREAMEGRTYSTRPAA